MYRATSSREETLRFALEFEEVIKQQQSFEGGPHIDAEPVCVINELKKPLHEFLVKNCLKCFVKIQIRTTNRGCMR